jgi:hypothetical protein
MGAVEITRTSEAVVIAQGGGTADVAVTEDPRAGTGDELRRRFSVVGDRLAPESDSQRVYTLEWSAAVDAGSGSGAVAFETGINDFSPNRYGTLSFFLYLHEDSSAPVTDALDASGVPEDSVEVSLAPYGNAPEDARITIILPAAELTDRWHQVEVSLSTGEVRIDGDPTDLPASIPTDGDYLRTVEVAVRGLSAGTLSMDELHASNPTAGLSAAGDVDAAWHRSISEGWLSGTRMTVEQQIVAQGEDFRAAAASSAADRSGTPVGRSLRSTTVLRGEREHLLTEVQTTLETNGAHGNGAFGHRLHLPVAPEGAIRVRERFYRDYAPRNSVANREIELTSAGDWGTWRLSTANRADQREILQEWGLSATPPELGSVATTVITDFSVRSLDQTVDAEPYGASWLASSARVIPLSQNGGRQERTGDAILTAEVGRFEFSPTGGWINRASVSADQTDRLGFSTRWPVSVRTDGSRPWEILPEYRRSWSLQRTSTSRSLSSDGEQWGQSVARDVPAITAIPVVELFQPTSRIGYDALGPEDVTRTHEAEARVRFGRALGSRPRDLYLPSEVTAGIARNRRWESDSREDRRIWELEIAATAINLYGAQGSRPRFSWYRSDEYENRVGLRLSEPVGGVPDWGVTVGQTTRIFGFEATEGELASSVEVEGSDPRSVTAQSSAVLRWRTLRYPTLSFFERMEDEPYYQHEERLAVEASFEEGGYRGSEVVMHHRTTLVIGANGTISAYGDLGWFADPARYEEGTLHVIGLQIGLEGRLEY